jgi:hypothetical protein
VWRLDRLAHSSRDLLETMETIREAGACFQSLSEPWANTTTHARKLIITVFAAIAEFERDLIRERSSAGRDAARRLRDSLGASAQAQRRAYKIGTSAYRRVSVYQRDRQHLQRPHHDNISDLMHGVLNALLFCCFPNPGSTNSLSIGKGLNVNNEGERATRELMKTLYDW